MLNWCELERALGWPFWLRFKFYSDIYSGIQEVRKRKLSLSSMCKLFGMINMFTGGDL